MIYILNNIAKITTSLAAQWKRKWVTEKGELKENKTTPASYVSLYLLLYYIFKPCILARGDTIAF